MPVRKPKDPDRSPDLPHDWISRQIARLEPYRYYDPIKIEDWHIRRARYRAPGVYEFIDTEWHPIHLGEEWGGKDLTIFFETNFILPETHIGSDTYLDIDMDGGETQLSINGYPWQGLDFSRNIVPLGKHAENAQALKFEMEAFVINFPYDERRKDERDLHIFKRFQVEKLDHAINDWLNDVQFAFDVYLSIYHADADLEIEAFLRHHLEEACRLIHPAIASTNEARIAATNARQYLHKHVYDNHSYQKNGLIDIIGHSHLDIIYLWPIKETFRKNCRTNTNMLSLMREYPEFCYSQSQPYLYEKLKEMYPAVYDEVKQRIQEGRWEAIGAMYVEPDGNVLGAESLVRQILFGKRFLREEFGIESRTVWLPDVFGVMYTLPQVLKKSGIDYFSTVKLKIWADTNPFPHNSFWWRGPDGTDVLTHFPASHFGKNLDAETVRQHWRDFQDKNTVGESMFVYGLADGGGGPTREEVERGRRLQQFPGMPTGKVEFVETFFEHLEQHTENLPVWDDELYLEAHRGTYTTKADLKRQNRKAELLYRDVEIISALASLFGGERMQEEINKGWKLVLVNQFHDTLPGTHRPEGVPDIKHDYETAFQIGNDLLMKASLYLAQNLDVNTDMVFFNTLSWQRSDLVKIPVNITKGEAISGLRSQTYDDFVYCSASQVPSLGWEARDVSPASEGQTPMAAFDGSTIHTPLYRIKFNDAGEITSLYDLSADHEVLTGPGNQFQVFEDDPGFKFSAWDIAYHFEEYQHPITQTSPWQLVANGNLFAVFNSKWRVLDSIIEQEMWLYADNPRIDFRTKANWQNQRKLLKVAFPLNIRTRTATYDLPFGNIERPTHRNTSWDQAKFEVCGHKWADLSEGNYGVALLNDCKYGYDAKENVLRLSLVRSPVRPDPTSDLGNHEFTYSILPHAGNWRHAHVDRHAYELNIPVHVVWADSHGGGSIPSRFSLLNLDASSIIIEALKQPEKGEGLILRIFDNHGSHVATDLNFSISIESIDEVNLMEENPERLQTNKVNFSPYEIKTYRIKKE